MTLLLLILLPLGAALVAASLTPIQENDPAHITHSTDPLSLLELAMLFEGWALALQAGIDAGSVVSDTRILATNSSLERWLRPATTGLASGQTLPTALRRTDPSWLPPPLRTPWRTLADRAEHGLPLAPHLLELSQIVAEEQARAAERWAQTATLAMTGPQFLLFLAVLAVCLLPIWGMRISP